MVNIRRLDRTGVYTLDDTTSKRYCRVYDVVNKSWGVLIKRAQGTDGVSVASQICENWGVEYEIACDIAHSINISRSCKTQRGF